MSWLSKVNLGEPYAVIKRDDLSVDGIRDLINEDSLVFEINHPTGSLSNTERTEIMHDIRTHPAKYQIGTPVAWNDTDITITRLSTESSE